MKKRYIISIICFICFLLVTALVVSNSVNSFDDAIYNGVFSLRNDFFDFFFKTITSCANVIPVIIIAAIICIFLRKNNCYVIMLVSNLVLSVASNQLFKHIICRARPDHLRLVVENGFSYPSGHSMISVFLYGTLMYILMKKTDNKKLKIFYAIVFPIFIFLIGLSRVYVGVHYPSDVLGGFLLSISIIVLSIPFINSRFKGE